MKFPLKIKRPNPYMDFGASIYNYDQLSLMMQASTDCPYHKKPKAVEPSGKTRSYYQARTALNTNTYSSLAFLVTFSYPDYTVGSGLSPDRASRN
jgi:hypothetical protein